MCLMENQSCEKAANMWLTCNFDNLLIEERN